MPITRNITISGETAGSLGDIYDVLSRSLAFPEHFGRNLDALWDLLSTETAGPFEITWKHSGLSKKRMGKDFDSLIVLLRDLEAEREDFRFTLEP